MRILATNLNLIPFSWLLCSFLKNLVHLSQCVISFSIITHLATNSKLFSINVTKKIRQKINQHTSQFWNRPFYTRSDNGLDGCEHLKKKLLILYVVIALTKLGIFKLLPSWVPEKIHRVTKLNSSSRNYTRAALFAYCFLTDLFNMSLLQTHVVQSNIVETHNIFILTAVKVSKSQEI